MNEQEVRREQAAARAAGKRHKRRRRVRWQFIVFVALFAAAVLTALCLTVLFPVRNVTAQGESRYTPKEITDVAAIEQGSNIILLDGERAEQRVLEQLPFIGECRVEKKLSGKVTVSVAELPGVSAYLSGEQYYIINEKNKVLEVSVTEPENVCILVGVESASPAVGQTYTPDEASAAKAELLQKLTDSIRANEIEVTRIDVSEESGIRFVVENRILVKFGSISDLEYKMAHLASTLKSMSSEDEGTLDLTWWTTSKKDAYFRRGNILTAIYGEDYVLPEEETTSEEITGEAVGPEGETAEDTEDFQDAESDETADDTEYSESADEDFDEE